ncbi:MAG: tetratricopeptide repeat protein [Armatimonadota bacterium]
MLRNTYPQSPAAKRVPEGLFAVGEGLFDKGKYPEAQAAYQRLLDTCPGSDLSDEAQYKIGWSLLKQEKPEAALPFFLQATEQASLPAVAADARFQAGRLSLDKGDAKQAAAVLEAFLTQYQEAEKAAAALVLLGRADAELKLNDKAAQVYQLVLTRYPKDPVVAEAWLGLARLYREQKATDKALEALGHCLAGATGVVGAEAQYEFAACYQQKGDTKRALEEFLKVAILYPDPRWGARATYEAGQCHEQLGDKESALKDYKLVGRDYPGQQPWAGQAEARLKALQP